MSHYSYNGPVMVFGCCVTNHFKASTCAESERKARSNIMYQYKKKYNKTPGAKICLPGEIMEV